MAGNTPKLTNKVSPHVQYQLPEFVQADHPQFALFLKHYYQFLESAELTLGGSNDFLIQETNSVNYILDQQEENVVLEESVGKFVAGEKIRGETTGYTAKILVDDYDNTKVLYISSQQKFQKGETVVGLTSGAKAPVVSYRANPVQNIQQLLAYADVDNTVYDFLDNFKDSIMESIPESIASGVSKRNLMKNIRSLYEAKGTLEGHKLFFRILFDEESSLLYPRENVLRVSNGQWSDDLLMRVTEIGTSDFNQIIGQVVTGETSGATAVCQTIVKYKEGAQLIAELNLDRTTISGTFTIGETINAISNDLDQLIRAEVSGIVGNVTVTEQGQYYKVDDKAHFENLGSIGVQGAITDIGEGGIDQVHVESGGTGYVYDDVITFNNSNTNGSGAAAKIKVLGGALSLELETEVDNIVYEGETHHNDIIIEHVDNLLMESGDTIIYETGEKVLREESEDFKIRQEQNLSEPDTLLLETGDVIIVEDQTFTDLGVASETGSLSRIEIFEDGGGYTTLPSMGITSSTGSGGSILALSNSGVGKVLKVGITNLGLGYTSVPDITMNRNVIIKNISGNFTIGDTFTSHTASIVSFNPVNRLLELKTPVEHFTRGEIITTATGASAEVVQCVHSKSETVIGATIQTGGRYVSDRGQISESSMKVQDSFYYQDYSYVVRIGESINTWRDSVRRSIHPAGWNVFGEVSFATSLEQAQLNSLRIRNPAAGDIYDFTGDTGTFTPELASTFRTLFTTVFGRRLGTTTDSTSVNANAKVAGEDVTDFARNEREVTLTQTVSVRLDRNRLNTPFTLGPTLENLAKYAFAVPPIGTAGVIPNYTDPIGRSVTPGYNDTRDLYPIGQFGHIRINQVSDSNGDIPDAAYNTRINVMPPSEIIIDRGGLINRFDNDFVSFDNIFSGFDEETGGTEVDDTEGRYATSFDQGTVSFDATDDNFDTDANTGTGLLSLFSTIDTTFDKNTQTYDSQ